MSEIKCPHCGSVFKVDDSGYTEILTQVKNAEFQKELLKRENDLKAIYQSNKEVEISDLKAKYNVSVITLKQQISDLNGKLELKDKDRQLAVNEATQAKENEIIKLKNELDLKEKQFELDKKTLSEGYESELKQKQTEVDYYKELKAKLSTKLVGETLEGIVKLNSTESAWQRSRTHISKRTTTQERAAKATLFIANRQMTE